MKTFEEIYLIHLQELYEDDPEYYDELYKDYFPMETISFAHVTVKS